MSAAIQQNPQFHLKLSVVSGPHAGQVFQLMKEKITIGRGPENDVVLMNDPQISRLHAQLILVERDFEIVKISQKNSVLVAGESVERWKLTSGTTFVVGESEIKIEFDLGRAVVSIPQQQPKPAEVIPLKSTEATNVFPVPGVSASKPAPVVKSAAQKMPPPSTVKNSSSPTNQVLVSQRNASTSVTQQHARPMSVTQQQAFWMAQQQAQSQQVRSAQQVADSGSLFSNPKFRFYAIAIILIGGIALFLMGPKKITRSSKPKPLLKYEDEISIKLNSTPEKELVKQREEKKIDRNSAQYQRAQENFIRGMRDYGLGNYARAQEFFQVVLNLDPYNTVAKRHLLLSKVRFEELVQAKLMLGESYYNKHNFDMCLSMYQQVMNMLDDKRSDTKYKLAEKKAKECELAAEGIR